MDVWEPLLAIAEHAGDSSSDRARVAAVALSGSVEDLDIRVELLRDIRTAIRDYAHDTVIPSQELVENLSILEDRPWGTWTNGKPITTHKLSQILRPLGIRPIDLESHRGYRVDAFGEAIARYLPSENVRASVEP
jgi:hypothetical protein